MVFVKLSIVLDVLAFGVYAWSTDYARAIYWLAAAVITGSTLWMR